MGRKNNGLARFPDLDRPFHLSKKIAGTAGRGAAALRATPCTASLCGTAAVRNVMPVATQNSQDKDNYPFFIVWLFMFCFLKMGRKNRGLAGVPDRARPEEGAACFAEQSPERPFRSDSSRAPHKDASKRRIRISLRKGEAAAIFPSPASAGEVQEGAFVAGRLRPFAGVSKGDRRSGSDGIDARAARPWRVCRAQFGR